MKWRKLIPRLVALVLLAVLGLGYVFYQRYSDPAALRVAVLAELAQELPGAEIRLGSAEMHWLGGIELTGLELSRRAESGAAPFAVFPSVVLRPDKEELARGRVLIRKVELKGPKLTVVRRSGGDFNLVGVLDATSTRRPAPVVEIHGGSIIFVDEMAGGTRLALDDVSLKAVPGSDGVIAIEATGRSDLGAAVSFEGTANQVNNELQLRMQISNLRIERALGSQLGAYLAGLHEEGIEVAGLTDIGADLAYRPSAGKAWDYTLIFKLREATVRHPRFPLALNQVAAVAEWNGARLTLKELKGRTHGAVIEAHGAIDGCTADADFALQIQAHHLEISRELYEKLPPPMTRLCADFQPSGAMSLQAAVNQKSGRFAASYTATLEGMSILFKDFPYPVDDVRGELAFKEAADGPVMKVQLAGKAGGQQVKLSGQLFGEGLRPELESKPGVHLDIAVANLPIDERGVAVLPESTRRVARQFGPTGLVDVLAEIRRPAGTSNEPRPGMQNRYLLRFHDATMCYEMFPYPLEGVEGTLELLSSGRWTFTGFKGAHRDGRFSGWARSTPTSAGDHIEVVVSGVNALLDQEMEAALKSPRMAKAYQLFSPQGRVDFATKVDIVGKAAPDMDLQITARNCAMRPSCFPYLLTNVTGTFRYAKDRVFLNEFQARHGKALIKLGLNGRGGEVLIRPQGGFRAVLTNLHAEPLTVDAELLKALPSLAAKAFGTLAPDRPIRIITDLTIDDPGPAGQPTYAWNGHAAFADCRLHCGVELAHVTGLIALAGSFDGADLKAIGNIAVDQMTLSQQLIRNVKGELSLTQRALVFPGLHAELLAGELYGPVRIEFGDGFPYRVDLTASRIDLEQFARETLGRSGQVKGSAAARLVLSGKGDDLSSLRGNGWVRVTDAKLYDLPLILDLLSAISGRLPKGSAFQEANLDFAIDGSELQVSRLELLGDAISLRGNGAVRVDGSDIKLEMYGLLWGRTLPLLPPLIDQIPPWLSKRLMLIRVRGDLAKVNARVEPVPFLVEPLRELLKTVGGRQKMEESPSRSP
jgi:hypothetical protein